MLGLIGLAMKAGKVCFGADSVEENIVKRKVKLLIICRDIFGLYKIPEKDEFANEKTNL